MGQLLFWKKSLMWNPSLSVVHNECNDSLSERYSIRYQLVLSVDCLNLVGTRSNEIERNVGFFHVKAPHSSTWVRGRSWLITFARLLAFNENATFSASVNVCGTVDGFFCYFFIMFRCFGLEFRFYDFVPQSVRVRIDRVLCYFHAKLDWIIPSSRHWNKSSL